MRSTTSTATSYTLSENITNYMFISIEMWWQGVYMIGHLLAPADAWAASQDTVTMYSYANTGVNFQIGGRSATTLSVTSSNTSCHIRVRGIIKK